MGRVKLGINKHFFEVETHSFKLALHVWADQHPSSVANTSELLVRYRCDMSLRTADVLFPEKVCCSRARVI